MKGELEIATLKQNISDNNNIDTKSPIGVIAFQAKELLTHQKHLMALIPLIS